MMSVYTVYILLLHGSIPEVSDQVVGGVSRYQYILSISYWYMEVFPRYVTKWLEVCHDVSIYCLYLIATWKYSRGI